MRVAVYTIAKNEEQFVSRWVKSCWHADSIIILDTGSTDGTVERATELLRDHPGQNVVATKVFSPWRFDHARNESLRLVPDDVDICIALDMDEMLQPGWRDALEDLMRTSPSVSRPRYKYVWSWNADGSEGLVYGGDKIHRRHGYRWKHPVHEVLQREAGIGAETQAWVSDLVVHHHPDPTKSRGQYLPLLELAVAEDPDDDRNRFYLGREYMFTGRHADAVPHFVRHLELSRWAPERAASFRWLAKAQPEQAEGHLWRAVAEDPGRRESWVDLASLFYRSEDWLSCRFAAERALRIKDKPLDYLCEAFAWGELPHDLAAIACYHLGDKRAAVDHGSTALRLNPLDPRLQANLAFYKG